MAPSRTAISMLVALGLLVAGLSGVPTAQGKSVTIVIEMKDFQFHPNEVRANPGDAVTIHVFNNETTAGVPHTFDIDSLNVHIGTRATPILSGQDGVANFTASQNGTFWFHCDIQGHATPSADGSWSGMAGRLIIGQAGTASVDLTPYLIGGIVVIAAIGVAALVFARRRK